MDILHYKQLYRQWSKEERKLENDLSNYRITHNVRELKRKIKKMCKHTDVTKTISPGWERSQHTYTCNQCGFYVQIHDEFDYRNITKVVDY
jgi:transcriptional regulator with AAA-type ATPase domain